MKYAELRENWAAYNNSGSFANISKIWKIRFKKFAMAPVVIWITWSMV